MYLDYFGIKANPFSLTPDPRYLYMAKGHQEALAHLLYGVGEGGGFVLLTGEVGTGKTSVCRCLLEQLPEDVDVAFILNPRLTETELLAAICDELEVDYPGVDGRGIDSLKALVDVLNAKLLELHAAGRRAVVIIDEAQNLSPEVLEQVRLLTNLETTKSKLLQVILIGQPELGEILKRKDMRQLVQRISARYHLEPLRGAETKAYVRHRLEVAGMPPDVFSNAAITAIHRRSGGIPRLINVLCDRCLLAAYAQDSRRVDTRFVRSAAKEVFRTLGSPRLRRLAFLPRAAAATAAVLALVAIFAWVDADQVTKWTGWRVPNESPPVDQPREAAGDATQGNGSAGPDLAEAAARPVPPESAPSESFALPEPLIAEPQVAAATLAAAAAPVALAPVPANENAPPDETELGARQEAARAPTLADLFGNKDLANDREAALVALFDLWRLDYGRLAGGDPCEKARDAGLRCLSGQGTWETLENMNRPALIPLDAPDGGRLQALLSRSDGETVTLEVGESAVTAARDEVLSHWSGDYLILWKPPPTYRRSLKLGTRGADVAWLKARLAEIRGDSAEVAKDDVFDAELKAEIIAFQESRPLVVDGIVGARTLIQLNNAAGAPSVAVLREIGG